VRTLTIRVYTADPADFLTPERARYPLPGASVEIGPAAAGRSVSWTSLGHTHSGGQLHKRVAAGRYRVTVRKAGYYGLRPGSSFSRTVDVFTDQEVAVLLRKDQSFGIRDLSVTRGEYWFLYRQRYGFVDDYHGSGAHVDRGDWSRFAGPFRTRDEMRAWKADNAPSRSGMRHGYEYRERSRHTWFDADTSWQ
jgi:hypothetical protein